MTPFNIVLNMRGAATLLKDPNDIAEATRLINTMAADPDTTVSYTKHGRDRQDERNVPSGTIQLALERGHVEEVRPPNGEHRDYRYRVRFTGENDRIDVVTVIISRRRLLIVTAWRLD